MLTMKILYPDGTEWVGGVAQVREMGVACLGGDDRPEDPRKAADEVIDLFPGPAKGWRGTIHVGSYPPGQWVKALVVERIDGTEGTWIVPMNDTYLLGPDGSTIDRI